MKIEQLNRFTLFVLMCYCIFSLYTFNSKMDIDIKTAKVKLEVENLKKDKSKLDIRIQEHVIDNMDKD